MAIKRYIYESHMGGYYFRDNELKDTYCDTCGDSDYLIGTADTKEEALNIIKGSMFGGMYEGRYIDEILYEEWGD